MRQPLSLLLFPAKSYAKVGDKIALTAKGTDNPTSFKWTLPADVKLVRGGLTDATIEVEALKEGKPEITVELTNAQGTGSFKGVAFDVFSDLAYKEVHNAAIGKNADCGRAVIGNAAYLIDGDSKPNNKDYCWSDISTAPYAVIDLKTPHTIYDFTIYDCKLINSASEGNIANYRILVSDNGTDWKEVADATETRE